MRVKITEYKNHEQKLVKKVKIIYRNDGKDKINLKNYSDGYLTIDKLNREHERIEKFIDEKVMNINIQVYIFMNDSSLSSIDISLYDETKDERTFIEYIPIIERNKSNEDSIKFFKELGIMQRVVIKIEKEDKDIIKEHISKAIDNIIKNMEVND